MASIIRKVILTPKAVAPLGPYSQAVLVDKTLYVAGQIGINPESGTLVSGGVENEAKQSFTALSAICDAAGASLNNVVKTTIYLQDMQDWPKVNQIYETFFKVPYPARTAIQVAALPKGALVEVEAVAVIGDIKDQ